MNYLFLMLMLISSQVIAITDGKKLISRKLNALRPTFLATRELCSANLIGPRVVITAAHCVKRNGRKSVIGSGAKFNGLNFTRIEMHPLYNKNKEVLHGIGRLSAVINYDIAIGILENEPEITPFTLKFDSNFSNIQNVIIAGAANFFKTFLTHYGVTELRSSTEQGLELYSPTFSVQRGDSGGAVLTQNDNGEVSLIGVLSMGSTQDISTAIHFSGDEIESFIRSFAKLNNVEICGVNKECGPVIFKDSDLD